MEGLFPVAYLPHLSIMGHERRYPASLAGVYSMPLGGKHQAPCAQALAKKLRKSYQVNYLIAKPKSAGIRVNSLG